MKATEILTLSEIAEKDIRDFSPADYEQFQIGSLENKQIICYFDGVSRYIALINPQDENYLFFADEFPYDSFSEFIQNEIDSIFENI